MRAMTLAALLAVSFPASAAPVHRTPHSLGFQGFLTDSAGKPLAGAARMRFKLLTGGTAVWCAEYAAIEVMGGYFTVLLGEDQQAAAALNNPSATCTAGGTLAILPELLAGFGTGATAEIQLEVFNGSSYEAITPNFQLASAPFALSADTIDGFDSSQLAKVNAANEILSASGAPVISPTGRWIGPAIGVGASGASGTSGTSGATGATGAGATGVTGATGGTGADGSQGPVGNPGVTGASGASGASGTTGATGATGAGATGETGLSGASGATGQSGATGGSGASGASGATGATGQTGLTGASGAPGATGAGATGETGLSGATGATGQSGASGSTGQTGMSGSSGATGATGATGAGATGASGLSGATGQTGLTGATGATGASGQSGATGATGQSGASGATGATGAGETGATGQSGATGATGQSGASGATGATGQTGVSGATGATGQSGATGATGQSGATGASGTDGSQGPAGNPGVTGQTGATGATGPSCFGSTCASDTIFSGNETFSGTVTFNNTATLSGSNRLNIGTANHYIQELDYMGNKYLELEGAAGGMAMNWFGAGITAVGSTGGQTSIQGKALDITAVGPTGNVTIKGAPNCSGPSCASLIVKGPTGTTGSWSIFGVDVDGDPKFWVDAGGNTASKGQIYSSVYDNGAANTIDWDKGNIQISGLAPGSLTFSNMREGGSYTLICTSSTAGQFDFTHAGASFRFDPANGSTTASSHTVYSFMRAGNVIYTSWITGFVP